MPRLPKPYWKSSHRCWYCKINGRHYRLHPDKKQAWEIYHKLMAERESLTRDSAVAQLINRYLDWSETHNADRTYRWYAQFLLSFGRSLPRKLKLSRLRPFHVTSWVDSAYPPATASPSTRHGAVRAVQRAFNWAVEQGLIDRSPLCRMKKPTPNRRETCLTPEQYQALLTGIAGPFRDIVEILRHTGCRPEEARKVSAAEFNRGDRCWNLPAGFTAKIKRPRIVPLDGRAFEICSRVAGEGIPGPIFRSTRGDPWTKDTLGWQFRQAGKQLGFLVTAYTLRHTFATEAILAGVDLVTIAEIMGHSDLTMLQRVYQHINQRPDHLRASLERATSSMGGN